jgi:hypothetical protein
MFGVRIEALYVHVLPLPNKIAVLEVSAAEVPVAVAAVPIVTMPGWFATPETVAIAAPVTVKIVLVVPAPRKSSFSTRDVRPSVLVTDIQSFHVAAS